MNHKVKFFDIDTYYLGIDGDLPFYICQTNGVNVSNIKINKELCNALNKVLTSFEINLAKAKNRAKVTCKQTFTITDPKNTLERFIIIIINLAEANNEMNWMFHLHSNESSIGIVQNGVTAIKTILSQIDGLEKHATYGKYNGIELTNVIPDPTTMTEDVCYVLTKEIVQEYAKDTVFMAKNNKLFIFDKVTGELTRVGNDEEETPEIQEDEVTIEEEPEVVPEVQEEEREEKVEEIKEEVIEEAVVPKHPTEEEDEENIHPYLYKEGQLFKLDNEGNVIESLEDINIVDKDQIFRLPENNDHLVIKDSMEVFIYSNGKYEYLGFPIYGTIDENPAESIKPDEVFFIKDDNEYLSAYWYEGMTLVEKDLPVYETDKYVMCNNALVYVYPNEYIGEVTGMEFEPVTSMPVIIDEGGK